MQIYGLTDPRSGALRYVGVTKKPLERRLKEHLRTKENNHRSHWIRSLLRENIKPEIFSIEECNRENWQQSERFWIAYFKSIGADLVNTCFGGFGIRWTKSTKETCAKVSKSLMGNTRRRGKLSSPETCAKNNVVMCEWWNRLTEEQRAEQSNKMNNGKKGIYKKTFLGKHHTTEWCEMMSKVVTESNIRRTGSKNTLKTKLLKSMAAIMRYLPYTGA